MDSLQVNKANGFNDISPYFLKIGANISAYPLTQGWATSFVDGGHMWEDEALPGPDY